MATDAEKVKMYREKAKDTSVPQEVRNTYLDRANELERKAFEATKGASVTPEKKMMYGGMPVRGSRTATNKEKKMMGGGYAMPAKTPMAKGGAVKAPAASKKPMLAIMIGVGKPPAKDAPKGGPAKYMEFSNKGKPKGMAPVKAMAKKGK
jgi:hypothetical protein